MSKFVLFILLFIFSALIINVHSVSAANSTLSVSPQSGSFDKPFTASIVIDGRGDKFNAASAKVTMSKNLLIDNLVLGDCNFSYLSTPSKENPSFEGIILSSYSTTCTAYTLKVIPVATGKATIDISEASIKKYGDASEILSSVQDGSYSLTGATNIPSNTTTVKTSQKDLYAVSLAIQSEESMPINEADVTLNAPSGNEQQKGITDEKGVVQFTDLKEGIYDVIVEQNGEKVGEAIINVSGPNKQLTLGISLDAQKNNPLLKDKNSIVNRIIASPLLLGAILVLGLVLGIGVSLLVMRFINRRKRKE